MANRYWIANGAETSASIAANWADNEDGSGSNTVPVNGDTVHFGKQTTDTAGFGRAPCNWNLAISLTAMNVHEPYTYETTITATTIAFTAPSTITITGEGFEGFLPGMQITVSGATEAANNQSFDINTVDDGRIVVTQSSIVTEAAGDTVTVTNNLYVNVTASFTTALLSLNGTLKNASGSSVTISLEGNYDSDANQRYVLNGDNAQLLNANNIVYDIDASANGGSAFTYLDDGPHGILKSTVSTNRISPQFKEPTSTVHGACTIQSLDFHAGKIVPDTSGISPRNDFSRKFVVTDATAIDYDSDEFDAGLSTWEFRVTSGSGWEFPVTGSSNFGAGNFNPKWYDVIIGTPTTAGWKTTLPVNTTLSVNSITVNADAVLEGTSATYAPPTIVTKAPPKIAGAWNFVGVGQNVFVSDRDLAFSVTPAHGEAASVQVAKGNGHFDSRTLTAGSNMTITDNGTTITFASSGGGGGGTVDVVSNVATNTILGRNDAGSGDSEELTPAEVRTMLNVEDGADVTDATNVTAAGALMDSEVTNLAQVKAFNSADYATAAQGAKADSALQAEADTLDTVANRGATTGAALTAAGFIMPGGTSAQKLTADGGFDATVYIPTGQYEAGTTPISAKGFIDTGTDTSWIAQSSGSRAIPAANGSGSSQVFSQSTTTVVTAWNQDLVTEQGLTYSSGIWEIVTTGVYEIYGKFGFLDGDASGSNTLGNPSSSSFIQSIAHIVYTSDGSTPGASDILVRGPILLFTNGTGLSAKGPDVRTVRRFDAGDKVGFAVFNRLQSNQSTSKKYRLRSGYYNECSIRRIG